MKDYYNILGVNRDASGAEIKRAYRRLVVKYHPDKNRDETAHDQIREINEAYDVLGDPEKKRVYDLGQYKPLLDAFTVPQEPPPHRDPAYRRRRPVTNATAAKPTMRDLLEKYLPHFVKVSLVSFGFCMLLFLDYLLPFTKTLEKVIEKYHYQQYATGRYAHPSQVESIVIVTNENRYRLADIDHSNLNVGDLIFVTSSRILKIPISVQWANGNTATFQTTLYRNFVFLPLILLVTSSLGIFLKRPPEWRFNLGIINGILLILNIVILFTYKLFV
jgi:curved DNA-binding protein CbpA